MDTQSRDRSLIAAEIVEYFLPPDTGRERRDETVFQIGCRGRVNTFRQKTLCVEIGERHVRNIYDGFWLTTQAEKSVL